MTREEKQLLLKDLCGRLPYGVKVRYATTTVDGIEVVNVATLKMISTYFGEIIMSCHEGHEVRDIKMDGNVFKNIMPLLRPMSSMTEEEQREFNAIPRTVTWEYADGLFTEIANNKQIDWLNAHHFDYRGLIEKNLALKAPEGMYVFIG